VRLVIITGFSECRHDHLCVAKQPHCMAPGISAMIPVPFELL
jgi:hypothetical protein